MTARRILIVEDDAVFARTLGGTLQAANGKGGGAAVTLDLPLAALALPA